MIKSKSCWQVAIASTIAASAVVIVGCKADRRPVELLDEAWAVVDRHYFDPTFNGYNWPGVRRTFSSATERSPVDRDAADKNIDAMLALLEVSHLQLIRPGDIDANHNGERYMIVSPIDGGAVGATISLNSQTRMPIVLNIDSRSPIYSRGVRKGDRLLFYINRNGNAAPRVQVHHINSNGVEADFEIGSPALVGKAYSTGSHGAPVAYRVEDVSSASIAQLAAERAVRPDPNRPVIFDSLALTTTLGQSGDLPKVADLRPGSPAVQAGVELDATVLSLTSRANGGQTLIARNPDGRLVTVAAPPRPSAPNGNVSTATNTGRCRVVDLRTFDATSVAWLEEKVREGNPSAVIIDLRHNGGGTASAMQRALGLLLPPGTIVGHGRSREGLKTISALGISPAITTKLWLLIGPASASASEILAAAIRDAGRGITIGRRTAGAVLEAKNFTLSHGYAVQIPVGSYLDRNGRPIEGIGVTPNITTWSTLADVRQSFDRPMMTALNAAACLPKR